jgi:hypothetical protein
VQSKPPAHSNGDRRQRGRRRSWRHVSANIFDVTEPVQLERDFLQGEPPVISVDHDCAADFWLPELARIPSWHDGESDHGLNLELKDALGKSA